MDKVKPDFRRMLLRLPHSASDYTAVALVAELATLLGADLIGTYVEDRDLRGLVDLPGAREFRAGRWQPLNSNQFALAMASASREAERLFLECASQHSPSFRVIDSASGATLDAGKDDIIVVIEPKSPIERATRQFSDLLEHTSRSASSILWIPSETKRVVGPIVVVAAWSDDPCISAALTIAAAAKEKLILVSGGTSTASLASALERAKRVGVMATMAEAAFHRDELLLPAHIKASLLITGREHTLQKRNLAQIPILLISRDRQSTSSDAQPKLSHSG